MYTVNEQSVLILKDFMGIIIEFFLSLCYFFSHSFSCCVGCCTFCYIMVLDKDKVTRKGIVTHFYRPLYYTMFSYILHHSLFKKKQKRQHCLTLDYE